MAYPQSGFDYSLKIHDLCFSTNIDSQTIESFRDDHISEIFLLINKSFEKENRTKINDLYLVDISVDLTILGKISCGIS